jgi:hypothetical protein
MQGGGAPERLKAPVSKTRIAVARIGRIDRRAQIARSMLRCRRTDARKIMVEAEAGSSRMASLYSEIALSSSFLAYQSIPRLWCTEAGVLTPIVSSETATVAHPRKQAAKIGPSALIPIAPSDRREFIISESVS